MSKSHLTGASARLLISLRFLKKLILLAAVCGSYSLAAPPNPLVLSLELTKQSYLKGEAVFATVTLANLGETKLKIKWPYLAYDYFEMYITDDLDRTYLYYNKRKETPDSVLTLSLAPGDSEYQVMDLLPLYGAGKPILRQDHTKTFFPPGTYRIQAGYRRDTDTSYSRILSFNVKNPQGVESKAYNLLVDASNGETDRKMDVAARALDSLIRHFPKSAYRIQAYLEAMQVYQLGLHDDRKAYETANALIQAYPASPAAVPALSFMLITGEKLGKTEKQNKELLAAIMKRHPGTLLARWAARALKHYAMNG